MADRPRKKRPRDPNARAFQIVQEAIGEADKGETDATPRELASRQAGRKGGKARSESLSAERRQEIARFAAQARWKKTEGG